MEAKERNQEAFLVEQRMQRMDAIAKELRVRQLSAPGSSSNLRCDHRDSAMWTLLLLRAKVHEAAFAGEVSPSHTFWGVQPKLADYM